MPNSFVKAQLLGIGSLVVAIFNVRVELGVRTLLNGTSLNLRFKNASAEIFIKVVLVTPVPGILFTNINIFCICL